MEEQILSASQKYPAVMLCGQRQVGKSTMLYNIKEPGRRYVTLDDGNARRLAENDPALFFESYPAPLLIDEVQRVPSLLLEMKRVIDEKALAGESTAGLYWMTGSQKFPMMRGVSESLAGRVAVFDMPPLSAAEIDSCPPDVFNPGPAALRERAGTRPRKTIHEIYGEIYRGSMPKVRASDIPTERFYADYVNTYIERDIKDLAQVGKLSAFYDFLVMLAARTGQALRYDELANAAGISSPTAKSWVSILERSGVIYLLRPYSPNITKRLVKTPKVYFLDTGLAAYLCRWPDPETLERGAMDGAFLETYAVSEIVKSYLNAGRRPDLYYYRDRDGREVDLVIASGGSLYPIEIKKAKQPANADRHFGALGALGLPVAPGVILCMSDEVIPYGKNTWYCPVWAI